MDLRRAATEAYVVLQHELAQPDGQPAVLPIEYPLFSTSNDLVYSLQEEDFSRELVNDFNQFAAQLSRLPLWDKIIKRYPSDQQFGLRHEFTALPLDYCLHFPYRFKQRIAFCATKLCYTTNDKVKLMPAKLIRSDRQITVESFIDISEYWPAGPALAAALRNIESEAFAISTKNYRNTAQHRHPQRLDVGHTLKVVRKPLPDARSSYQLGEFPPLLATDVLPSLLKEAEILRLAYFAYRNLINDHQAERKTYATTNPV